MKYFTFLILLGCVSVAMAVVTGTGGTWTESNLLDCGTGEGQTHCPPDLELVTATCNAPAQREDTTAFNSSDAAEYTLQALDLATGTVYSRSNPTCSFNLYWRPGDYKVRILVKDIVGLQSEYTSFQDFTVTP